jgi:predicted PurR-regulated permease PerM
VALLLTLRLHLLPAMLAGFLVYELVRVLAGALKLVRIHRKQGKFAAIGILATLVVLLLTLAGAGIVAFLNADNLAALVNKLADSLDTWRAALPNPLAAQLPADVDELRQRVVAWLRPHASELQQAGAAAGHTLAHILLGMGIGALVSLYDVQPRESLGPLSSALQERAGRFGEAFRRVVFAQFRISAVNTLLTGLYLLVALPIAGVHFPLANAVVVITFLVGILPVIGNLISNTIIVVLSLSVSLPVAIASFLFLIVIHKLEYFLNAHLIGTQIHAHAWELLLAMLAMEAAFGMPGLIAASIYYAYIKDELMGRNLV